MKHKLWGALALLTAILMPLGVQAQNSREAQTFEAEGLSIQFDYPEDWSEPDARELDDERTRYSLSSRDRNQFIIVDHYPAGGLAESLSDLEDLTENYLEEVNGDAGRTDEVTLAADDDRDALVTPYTYSTNAGDERMGWLVLVYVDEEEMGYRIDIDVEVSDEDEGEDLLNTVLDTLEFKAGGRNNNGRLIVPDSPQVGEGQTFEADGLEIRFDYPDGWELGNTSEPGDDRTRYTLVSEDQTQFIIVDHYPRSTRVRSLEDVESLSEAYLADVSADVGRTTDVELSADDDREALVTDYTYTSNNGDERVGWLILTYVEEEEQGYRIDIDVLADDENAGEDLRDSVLNSLRFSAGSTTDSGPDDDDPGLRDTRTFEVEDIGLSFDYPGDWVDGETDEFEDGSFRYRLLSARDPQIIIIDTLNAGNGVESLNDLENNGEDYLDNVSADVGRVDDVTLSDDREALVIPYTYEDSENNERIGWLVLVYVDERELGYRLDIDFPAEQLDEGEAVLQQVLESLRIDGR